MPTPKTGCPRIWEKKVKLITKLNQLKLITKEDPFNKIKCTQL